jgi:hypothetical protein
MPDHDDDEIGRKVVGAVVMEFFAAFFAVIGDLQKLAEQAAFPAVRAPAKKATPHGLGKRDRFFRAGHDGIP